MLKGVVFDLDGTLLDSEPVWDLVFKKIVEEAGKKYDAAAHQACLGTGINSTARILKDWFDLVADVDALATTISTVFETVIFEHGPKEKPGASQLLRALKTEKIPVAIATGTRRSIVNRLIEWMEWQDLISTILTVEEVGHAKPAPDIYLEAARQLGCGSGECVAFEDAPNGVASAKAAGFKVIGIIDPRFVTELTHTDKTIMTFNDVNFETLKSLAV